MNNAIDILKYYKEIGIDENIINKPVNNLIEKQIMAKTNIAPKNNRRPQIIPNQKVKSLVENIDNLEDLKQAVLDFNDLAIVQTATNTVFSDGNPKSEIMLIGEAPGAEEDLQGIPFCGASGKLLDQMLSCINLTREKNFYITNTIFWRPPGNRRPTPNEVDTCAFFVKKHIALIKPKLIVLIGATAVSAILNMNQPITKIRGKFFDYDNDFLSEKIPTTIIFHPSYLLRSPGQKKFSWEDCLMIQDYIRENNIKI